MISRDTYFLPVWIAIFVQSVTSLPEKAAHLSPWNWDDDDWFRPRSTTRSPYIWDRITYSPPDPFDKPRSTGLRAEPIVWIIVGFVIILSILAALLRYFCAHMDHGTDINRTGRVLHPPPVIIVPTPERTTLPQHSRNSTTVTLGGGLYGHPLTVPTYGVGDKPPGYSDVMMTDFGEEKLFPEVAQRLPDTPPPKYEDGNLPKY